MEISKKTFTIGQIVFGKIKGHIAWPALITDIPKGKTIVKIVYFNSGEHSILSTKNLTPFHSAGKIIDKHLNENEGFTKAYNEMLLVAQKSPSNTKKSTVKKDSNRPKVILKRLSKDDILKIQNDLKSIGKKKMRERKRLGRTY